MRFKHKREIPPRYILLALTIVCLILLLLSLLFQNLFTPLKQVTANVIVPMQSVINSVGSYISERTGMLENIRSLEEENRDLREQLEAYKAEAKQYQQDVYELARLQGLYNLDQQYPSYEKVAARVISKDSGNWFHSFTIDKGTDDGVEVDCNVLSGNGLVGIVTDAGTNWAKVRSIVDDTSKVSAMFINNAVQCTVTGNLQMMDNGYIDAIYIDKDALVQAGDELVTSFISDKYFAGITIGYIGELTLDSNNLTMSAKVIPVVDFSNIQEVLVIKDKKKMIEE